MMKLKHVGVGFAAAIILSGQAFAAAKVDPKLPEYSRASGVSGNVSSVGSDTLGHEARLDGEGRVLDHGPTGAAHRHA